MESKRRWRWSAAKARAALADQERSGLTIRAFCQERGWHPERLYRWRRRLEASAGRSSEEMTVAVPSFVRAEVNEIRSVRSPLQTTMLELVLCNGQRLCFPSEIEPEVLARTVRALEVGPC